MFMCSSGLWRAVAAAVLHFQKWLQAKCRAPRTIIKPVFRLALL
jgi:hypothetical protein